MDDAIKTDEFLKTAKNIAVIGGGMTGVEVARIAQEEEFRQHSFIAIKIF